MFTLYTKHLAQAIAHAPTQEEALGLWDAASNEKPSIMQVLQAAVQAHNTAAILACKQRLGTDALSLEDQGQVLALWKRSPTEPRNQSIESEQEIASLLAQEGLITGNAKSPQDPPLGPITCLINNFREYGARGLMGHIQPTAEDMSGALCHCTIKLSSEERRDSAMWQEMAYQLLEMGADPDLNTHYKKSSSSNAFPSCASNEAAMLANKWKIIPFDLLTRLLGGKTKSWTQPKPNSHTPLSQWIKSDGDMELGIRLGQGQTLPSNALQLILGAQWGKPFGSPVDRWDIWKLFDGRIQMQQVNLDQMTDMTFCALMPFLGKQEDGDKELARLEQWLSKASKHLPTLLAPEYRNAGKSFMMELSRDLPPAWKAAPKGAGNEENRREYFLQYLTSQMQGKALSRATSLAESKSRGPRL